jgi:non-specific serine/threonine protein kinase
MSLDEVVEYALAITAPVTPVTPDPAAPSVPTDPSTSDQPELVPLTPREREVAVLVARGLTNRQIAAALVVSERTVHSHVHNTLGKLALTSRAQLAVWAVERRRSSTHYFC